MPYVNVKELPETLIAALKECGYHKSDIQILVKDKESILYLGGEGYRGFACLVNMSTGESKTKMGSWGGSNMFNPNNSVDLDDSEYEIPENCAVIRGYTGGTSGVTRCTITLSPKNILPCFENMEDLSDDEKHILAIMRAYKPAYRKPYMEGKEGLIDGLVDRGYISRNKAGSLSLSVKGKNACENVRV
jgi:hypothetical protein